jgi:glyoxylase-like metal-dependent hydrolase (beta-lactamase superfamily II)
VEKIAEGVWVLRGDARKSMTIYFIEDGDGVVQFDAGSHKMVKQARAAAAERGGVKRVVLGHAHADHRGTAPFMDAPVMCHVDEIAEAESPESIPPYFELDRIPIAPLRWVYPSLMRKWDGGPVKIAETLAEGEEVAGFEVVAFPGHAPGQIGLWREKDRLALVSDTIYMIDSVGRSIGGLGKRLPEGQAVVPDSIFNQDDAEAVRSVRRLIELDPQTVCPGHAGPLRGPAVREALERAVETH